MMDVINGYSKIYSDIQERLNRFALRCQPVSQTTECLIENCRKLFESANSLANWAAEYDHEDTPGANGYWTWIRLIESYGRLIGTQYEKSGYKAFKDEGLASLSKVIVTGIDLVFKIRADSVAQHRGSLKEDITALLKHPNLQRLDSGITSLKSSEMSPISCDTYSPNSFQLLNLSTNDISEVKIQETEDLITFDEPINEETDQMVSSFSDYRTPLSSIKKGDHKSSQYNYDADESDIQEAGTQFETDDEMNISTATLQDDNSNYNFNSCKFEPSILSRESLNSVNDKVVHSNDANCKSKSLFSFYDSCVTEAMFSYYLLEDNLDHLYGKFCGFWLNSVVQNYMKLLVIMITFLGGAIKYWPFCIWDEKLRGNTTKDIIHHQDQKFLINYLRFPNHWIFNHTIPKFVSQFLFRSTSVRTVYISRQIRWLIDPKTYELKQEIIKGGHLSDFNFKQEVKCLFIKDENYSLTNNHSIILYLHGGMVAGSSDTNQFFLRDCVSKASGIPLLSIDYSLSPEAKFPVALQEALDVYIWLISRHKSVKRTLGFDPVKIMFVGNGWGGLLATSLCLLLNDMRILVRNENKKCSMNENNLAIGLRKSIGFTEGEEKFIMPIGIVTINSIFSSKILMSPSRAMYILEPKYNLNTICLLIESYVEEEPIRTRRRRRAGNGSRKSVFRKISLMVQTCYNRGWLDMARNYFWMAFNYTRVIITMVIARFFESPLQKLSPWYPTDLTKFQEKLTEINDKSGHPYISPMFYPNFDSLIDVPLTMITSHFDHALDDNVVMAKLWKGPLVLDVLNGDVPNGFLSFYFLDASLKQGFLTCVNRIRESFALNPYSEKEKSSPEIRTKKNEKRFHFLLSKWSHKHQIIPEEKASFEESEKKNLKTQNFTDLIISNLEYQ